MLGGGTFGSTHYENRGSYHNVLQRFTLSLFFGWWSNRVVDDLGPFIEGLTSSRFPLSREPNDTSDFREGIESDVWWTKSTSLFPEIQGPRPETEIRLTETVLQRKRIVNYDNGGSWTMKGLLGLVYTFSCRTWLWLKILWRTWGSRFLLMLHQRICK